MVINSITDITWDQATGNWDAFYADQYYAQYILDAYGIEVPPPYEILWDHAIKITVSFPDLGGASSPTITWSNQREKEKKKVKLIFIIDDLEKVFEKDKNNQVKVEFKDRVENILTEKFNQKVILEDVQIIHR
jgi:hypothetical protein